MQIPYTKACLNKYKISEQAWAMVILLNKKEFCCRYTLLVEIISSTQSWIILSANLCVLILHKLHKYLASVFLLPTELLSFECFL